MDYCSCGSAATFRCACGNATCNFHRFSPNSAQFRLQVAANNASKAAGAAPELAGVFQGMANSWGSPPIHQCASCFNRSTQNAARESAPFLARSQWNSTETMVLLLAYADSWQTVGLSSFGRYVLAAAGKFQPWIHDQAVVSVARAHARLFAPAPALPLYTQVWRRGLFGGKFRAEQTHLVRGWTLNYWHDEGWKTIVIGANGAFCINHGGNPDTAHLASVPPEEIDDYFSNPSAADRVDNYYSSNAAAQIAAKSLGL